MGHETEKDIRKVKRLEENLDLKKNRNKKNTRSCKFLY